MIFLKEKNKMKNLLLVLALSLTFSVSAHEGHNNSPGSFKSLHGGTVQNGKELNLEVIINGKELTVFPTSHEGKDVPAKEVKLTAQAKPKKGKAYEVKFIPSNNGHSATVDLQGANRLPIEISVTSKGKTDKFTVQVEE